MRASIRFLFCALALGCSDPPAEPELPEMDSPPGSMSWPTAPQGLPADVQGCIDDYRSMARTGLPGRPQEQPFADWYRGPFQAWTRRYNDVRGRCDAVFEGLDRGTAAAQIMLATQSYLHERIGEDATPYEEQPQMFVMARYWTLGAACTYQNCQNGPDRAWSQLCGQRARGLPPCPPVQSGSSGSE